MSLSAYTEEKIRIELISKKGDDHSFYVRGLSVRDVGQLFNRSPQLISLLVDGVDFTNPDKMAEDVLDKVPDLAFIIIALCCDDDNATAFHIGKLPIITQLQAINAILELTLPEDLDELEQQVKKLIAESTKLKKKVKK